MPTRLLLLSVLFLIQANFVSAQAIKDSRFFQMREGTWTSTKSVPVPEGSLMIATWKETDRYACRLILKDAFMEVSGTITSTLGAGTVTYKRMYRPSTKSPNTFHYMHFHSNGFFGEGTVVTDPGANTLTETTVNEDKTKSITTHRFIDANTLEVRYVRTDAKGAATYETVTTHKREKKIQSGEAND